MNKKTFKLQFTAYGNYSRNYDYFIEVTSTSLAAAISSVERKNPKWFYRGCIGAY